MNIEELFRKSVEMEELILKTLKKNNGDVQKTAKEIGVSEIAVKCVKNIMKTE